jgi:hypothetical protein
MKKLTTDFTESTDGLVVRFNESSVRECPISLF